MRSAPKWMAADSASERGRKRYEAVIDDGTVTSLLIELAGGLSVSSAAVSVEER